MYVCINLMFLFNVHLYEIGWRKKLIGFWFYHFRKWIKSVIFFCFLQDKCGLKTMCLHFVSFMVWTSFVVRKIDEKPHLLHHLHSLLISNTNRIFGKFPWWFCGLVFVLLWVFVVVFFFFWSCCEYQTGPLGAPIFDSSLNFINSASAFIIERWLDAF